MIKVGDSMSFYSKAKKKNVTGTVAKVNAKTYLLDIGKKLVKRGMSREQN